MTAVAAVACAAVPTANAVVARPPVAQRDSNDRSAVAISANGMYILTAPLDSLEPNRRINVVTKAVDTWTFKVSHARLAADGSAMVFQSDQRLVAADTDVDVDVYRYVFATRSFTRIVLSGRPSNWDLELAAINATGSVVAFKGTNILLGKESVWLFDDRTNAWVRPDTRMSSASTRASYEVVLDATGRLAAFTSGSVRECIDCVRAYLFNWPTGAISLISVKYTGAPLGDGKVSSLSMSPDGRVVSFRATSRGVVPVATDLRERVYIRDRVAGTNTMVSDRESHSFSTNPLYLGPQLLANGAMLTLLEDRPTAVGALTLRSPQPVVFRRATKTLVVLTTSVTGANPNGASRSAFGAAAAPRVLFDSFARNFTTVSPGPAGTVRVFVSTPV